MDTGLQLEDAYYSQVGHLELLTQAPDISKMFQSISQAYQNHYCVLGEKGGRISCKSLQKALLVSFIFTQLSL
jgi:hypothetical protein